VGGLANITSEEADSLVVAYEPVWAIGTGSVPTSGDIESAVRAIRSQIKHLFGEQTAAQVRVLYGGSVNIDNATSILAVKGVDGLLVGGASLNVEGFAEIIKKAHGPKSVKKKVNR
jgi:triosephosphate isomerase